MCQVCGHGLHFGVELIGESSTTTTTTTKGGASAFRMFKRISDCEKLSVYIRRCTAAVSGTNPYVVYLFNACVFDVLYTWAGFASRLVVMNACLCIRRCIIHRRVSGLPLCTER